MILQLPTYNQQQSPPRRNWKFLFKKSIYSKNQQQLAAKYNKSKSEQSLKRKQRKYRASHILKDHRQVHKMKDTMKIQQFYGYYSYFVPIPIHMKFYDNQITLTFNYLKTNYESNTNLDKCELILRQIQESMTKGKEQKKVDQVWLSCLRKYVASVDSIRAIEIYFQLKKKGKIKNPSLTLWQQFGGGCLPQIFRDKLQHSFELIKKNKTKILKQFSVESEQAINEVTMAKTAKQMFCSICLVYDCSFHSWEPIIKQKQFHFVAPKNIIDQHQRLKDAIQLCLTLREINKPSQKQVNKEVCCAGCYKLLTRESWEKVQRQMGLILSPVVKGFIKMGIQMYSYSPCKIWILLKDRNITCSHIFLSLIEDYNLIARIQQKLQFSEIQKLLHQSKETQLSKPTQQTAQAKKAKNKQKNRKSECPISSCIHYLIAQQPIDVNCQNCSCRLRNFCLPQCLCKDNCALRKKGCNCKKDECRTISCVCFNHDEECDPLICRGCFNASSNCKNHQIMSRSFKKVKAGRSTVEGGGIGLYSSQAIKKEELVIIYSGEIIDSDVETLRQTLRLDDTFYNFGNPEGSIDGRFMGNLSRFINHADQDQENLYARTMLSEARYKIAFYAKRDIQKGEELFFDYDGNGDLYKNHRNKYPFIRKKKKGA